MRSRMQVAGDGIAPLKDMARYEDERRQAKFAITEIHSAESAVNEARRNNSDIASAAQMLEQAKARYDLNEYRSAVELSLEIKKMVYGQIMAKK